MFLGEEIIEVLSTTEPQIAEVKRGSSRYIMADSE